MAIQTIAHRVPNGDGWELALHQTWDDERLVAGRRPVLIVPGYGMNSFIFSYHPRGASLEGFLAAAGFEAWRADLRAQGESSSVGGTDHFGLADLALVDLGAAIDAVLAKSNTGADRVDVIGASLGGTLLFIHVTLERHHRVGSMVAMGSPVRWVKIHPAIRLAFRSPLLVGAVRFRGTRKLVEKLLPLLAKRVPWLLSIYMNPGATDLSAAREMARTVEDPSRRINRQLAHWINARDLIVRGVNVAEALREVERPLLCVLANGDGIVPRETALFPYQQIGSPLRATLEVGTETLRLAHADLFVSNEAHARVFDPIARWLADPTSN